MSTAGSADGSHTDTGDGGPANQASIGKPRFLHIGPDESLYVTTYTGYLRRIDPRGIVTTLAGNGSSDRVGDDVCAHEVGFSRPAGIALRDQILVAADQHARIRILTPTDEVPIDPEDPTPPTFPTDVRLDAYDARGRHVASVLEGPRGPGEVQTTWHASKDLASGVYHVRLQVDGRVAGREKVVVLR